MKEIRTSTISSKGQIAIPQEMRKRKGFREGQKVVILAFEDRLEIRPLSDITRHLSALSMQTALMSQSSLAKIWNTPEEGEAWARLQKEK